MLKVIAFQAAQLNGNQNPLLSFEDMYGMVNLSLALDCQISEAEKTNRGKVIAEGVIGGTPVLDNSTLEARMTELERMYHHS